MNKNEFSIVLIGDSGSGKTSIISKYFNRSFDFVEATNGINLSFKEINLNNNTKIKLNIWDTPGVGILRSMIRFPLKSNCDGIILTYLINKKSSFDNIFEIWINEIEKIIDLKSIPVYLVGNNCDLEDKREVEKKEVENKSKEYNFKFMETSAINNININELFQNISEDIYNKYYKKEENIENEETNQINENNNIIIIQNNKPKKNVFQKVSNFFKKITKHFKK